MWYNILNKAERSNEMLTNMQIRLRDDFSCNEQDDIMFVDEDEFLLYGTFEDLVYNENLKEETVEME